MMGLAEHSLTRTRIDCVTGCLVYKQRARFLREYQYSELVSSTSMTLFDHLGNLIQRTLKDISAPK